MRARLQQYLSLLPAIALVFAFAACDSNDEQTDSELFIGDWNVTSVSDGDGTVELTNFSKIVIGFSSSAATITATPADASANQVFSGSYAVDEANNRITIQLTVTGIPTPIPVAASYSFSGDDTVTLTIGSATAVVLGPLFGTTFSGDVTLRVERE
jgi:hypothetical protein